MLASLQVAKFITEAALLLHQLYKIRRSEFLLETFLALLQLCQPFSRRLEPFLLPSLKSYVCLQFLRNYALFSDAINLLELSHRSLLFEQRTSLRKRW